MKWFGIILVLLSTLGVGAIFGFTLFSTLWVSAVDL